MLKEEFCKLIGKQADDFDYKDYHVIETVYTYHPCISETEGKRQVATLYKEFGLQIFQDMLPTAEKVKQWEIKEHENLYVANCYKRYATELREKCAKR